MRKIVHIVILGVGLFAACQQDYNYTITGKLQHSSDTVLFVAVSGQQKVDTVVCKEGQFTIKGNVDSLTYLTILIPEAGTWLDVWVNRQDRLSISGDVYYPDLLDVKGNEANERLSAFKSANQALLQERTDLFYHQQESVADTLIDNAIELNYSAKISNIQYQLEEKAEEFVKNNPASLASLVLIRDYLADTDNLEKMESCLSLIQAPATESPLYKLLDRLLSKAKRTSIGAHAPDFQIVDMKGDTISLSDFQGSYLLISFAASWCDVCRKDNKGLVKAYKRFRGKNLQFFTFSFDEDRKEWKMAANEDSINWRQAIDTQGWGAEMLTTYNITSIPANFLIDESGVIVEKNLFGDALERVLEARLK